MKSKGSSALLRASPCSPAAPASAMSHRFLRVPFWLCGFQIHPSPFAARCSSARSSFSIWHTALMTRFTMAGSSPFGTEIFTTTSARCYT